VSKVLISFSASLRASKLFVKLGAPLNLSLRNEGSVMKLLLVSPSHKFRKKLRATKMPQLSLHILASLTPNDVDRALFCCLSCCCLLRKKATLLFHLP